MSSCTKIVAVDPPSTALTGNNVYTIDGTAAATMTSVYSDMSGGQATPFATGLYSISIGAGLSADELSILPGSNATLEAQFQNALTKNIYPPFWQSFYNILHTVNSVLEGVNNSHSLTPAIGQQLKGEAYFMRAFCHFYLVNLYGDIPIVTSSDYQTNSSLARTSLSEVYLQIIQDLKAAKNLLSTSYLDATLLHTTTERVRPTYWAATAFLARAYLYQSKWDSAEAQASLIINNSNLYNLNSDLNSVFLKNSAEAIWQLQPVNSGWNTEDARIFLIPSAGPDNYSYPIYLFPQILNSFEAGDQRKLNWTGVVTIDTNTYYYPTKYKSANYGDPVTEYLMVLRLGEQYLIRAEARAQQNNIAGAQSDLNAIRTRAGLPNASFNDQASLLSAIQHERQVELFTEWGHRWLDLKRTGMITGVMDSVCIQKGGVWSSNWQFYPIPLHDIQQDANLTQNSGY